ncbi:hypothetical protein O6H91_03G116400 [Diphasiastrum complanatum]|uniref:Uncharacterized protein n=1 Tax=Diphasiastrum complanatum TaxID=34168 RepID=A0ACC2EAR6_DIPCM|nr:hypothetical protein O6H91_03G116400 [Diphasiastrum complanatum]
MRLPFLLLLLLISGTSLNAFTGSLPSVFRGRSLGYGHSKKNCKSYKVYIIRRPSVILHCPLICIIELSVRGTALRKATPQTKGRARALHLPTKMTPSS